MLVLILSAVMAVFAGEKPRVEAIYDTRAGQWLDVDQALAATPAGRVYVLGEVHAFDDNKGDPAIRRHHRMQVRWMDALTAVAAARGDARSSLGMEFFAYVHQPHVDRYLNGQAEEAEFLRAIGWAGMPFELYREQVLAPRQSGGRTIALNSPRALSGKVARFGPDALTAEERALLPPLWEQGSEAYRARFREATQGHVPQEKLDNYFWAQSLWDDTMAWRSALHLGSDPATWMTLIAGEFHVEFNLGLPARLRRHGVVDVISVLQTPVTDWLPATLEAAARPDSRFGPRADWLWVYLVD